MIKKKKIRKKIEVNKKDKRSLKKEEIKTSSSRL